MRKKKKKKKREGLQLTNYKNSGSKLFKTVTRNRAPLNLLNPRFQAFVKY